MGDLRGKLIHSWLPFNKPIFPSLSQISAGKLFETSVAEWIHSPKR